MSATAEAKRPTPAELGAIANPFSLLIGRYQRNPVGFVRDIFGAEPDPWQLTALMALARGHTRISIRSGHGVGKLQPVNEVVPTPEGNRRWGDLQPGDRLFGCSGEAVHIVARHDQGIKPIYRVIFDDGTVCRVGAEHLWTVRGRAQRRIDSNRLYRKGAGRSETRSAYADDFITLTTAEIMRRGVKRSNGAALARQWELPPHGTVQYPPQDVPIAPYLLGALLGDGSLSAATPTLHASAAKMAHWQPMVDALGLSHAVGGDGERLVLRLHGWQDSLRELGLRESRAAEKFVPQCYRENTPAVRLAVLQGLMDADGYCDRRGITVYTSVSRRLAEDVAWLTRSLGGKAFLGGPFASAYVKDGERIAGQPHYDVTVRLPAGMALFTLPYKAARLRHDCEPRYLARWIEAIEPDGEEEAMCVTVDAPDGLYLANDFICTHNSAFLAWATLWFSLTRFPYKVVVTAPSAPQLYDALWAEILSWLHKLPLAWQALLASTSDRIELRARPEDAFITARTSRADQPEALQGVHSAWVMLIADEASGVPEPVFEAAGGSMSTPGAITILTGNPTRSTGFFWRTQTLERDRWFCLKVSCLDSKRVDPNYAAEIAERRGIDSNAYRVRVLGEFPLADGDTMIAAKLIEDAMARAIEWDPYQREVWGVDVARFGTDRSVLIKRRNNVVREPPRRWAGLDTMQLVGQLHHEWNATAAAQRPALIVVDSIGIGAGVEDRLRELSIPVLGVNVADAPSVESRYMRLRDELWQRAADWLASDKVALPLDEQLRDDLAGPRYRYTSEDKLKVESKNEMRSRGVPSPDSADALVNTFVSAAISALAWQQARWGQPLRRNIRGATV